MDPSSFPVSITVDRHKLFTIKYDRNSAFGRRMSTAFSQKLPVKSDTQLREQNIKVNETRRTTGPRAQPTPDKLALKSPIFERSPSHISIGSSIESIPFDTTDDIMQDADSSHNMAVHNIVGPFDVACRGEWATDPDPEYVVHDERKTAKRRRRDESKKDGYSRTKTAVDHRSRRKDQLKYQQQLENLVDAEIMHQVEVEGGITPLGRLFKAVVRMLEVVQVERSERAEQNREEFTMAKLVAQNAELQEENERLRRRVEEVRRVLL